MTELTDCSQAKAGARYAGTIELLTNQIPTSEIVLHAIKTALLPF